MSGKRWGRASWFLGGFALALVLWLADLGHGISGTDDAWFVQVVDRVGGGDAVYEDVFYGVPPLSIWIALPFTEILGSELTLIKALNAAVIAATALLAAWTSGRLGAGRLGQALAALACIAYTAMPSVSFYNPLAGLLALGALALLTLWRESEPDDAVATRLLVLTGVVLGLAAGAKHTTGGYAAIAAGLAVAFASPRERGDAGGRVQDGVVLAAAAAATFSAVMVPVVVSGGLSDFVTYALDKRGLVELGSSSYLTSLDGLVDLAVPPWDHPRGLAAATATLVPPLAIVAVVALARVERARAVLVGGFAIAAIATIYPRADLTHIQHAVPACAVAIAVAGAAWAGARPPAAAAVWRISVLTVGALAAVAAIVLVDHPVRALEEGYGPESAPHLGGALVAPSDEAATESVSAALRNADGGEGATLLLTPTASYFYLASGLDSPTPFDYPLATDFRGDDEQTLIEMIDSGEIERVCVNEARDTLFEELMPRTLIEYVKSRLSSRAELGEPAQRARLLSCTLYEG